MKCYLTYLNRTAYKSMRYQLIMLMTPNNVTQPFALNERFHSSYLEKEQLFKMRPSAKFSGQLPAVIRFQSTL
nr:hypothetical protein [Candidatus Enterovibrio luxaltus]